MINPSLRQALLEQLGRLDADQQQRVLDFARALAITSPRGVPGKTLLPFAGTIPADDLQAMTQAIEEGCEQLDERDW
jgi:hypothetical protein